jgi:DNA (cytosine-5)-methyltransferase 1
MNTPTEVKVNVPEIATKQLKFRTIGERKILTISSNFLQIFGFHKGEQVIEKLIGKGKGIIIQRVNGTVTEERTKKVYGRTYTKRKNNPFETLLEVSSQKLISEAFPKETTRVHVLFEHDCVTVTPIASVSERAQANAMKAKPEDTFAALTSGVDLTSLTKEGFQCSAVLEFRPQEKRDSSDLTETGMLNAIANSGPLYAAFNEDINCAALDIIAQKMEERPVFCFHASPQCDDLSNVKSQKLKNRDMADASTTADMILDILNLIERLAPPIIVLENVPGMLKSAAYNIASLRLKRWGYTRHEHVGDARDYGGLTSRKRAYVIFTALNEEFSFETPFSPRQKDIWSIVQPYLEDCRDVSHSKSLQDGKRIGRLRAITPNSTSSPTPLKSQLRMAKDSLVIEPTPGVFKFPNEQLLARLLGIENINLNAVASTLASEIIGQSVDITHHGSILRAVKRHMNAWFSKHRPSKSMHVAEPKNTLPQYELKFV